MLDDVIGAYLDSLTEREFDAPFMALLRAKGYTNIHLTHGQAEFGKDVIARGLVDDVECQFVFQTKAGDLGLSGWREVRTQLDEARRNTLSHPGFDAVMPRRAVLVVTGRLTGQAPIEAQNYKQHVEHMGEVSVDVWDREDLLQMIVEAPELGLAGRAETQLLGAIAEIESDDFTDRDLERLSRAWITSPAETQVLLRASVIAAVVANRLDQRGRLDLACVAGLALVRASWATAHGADPPDTTAELVSSAGRLLFAYYAKKLYDAALAQPTEPSDLAFGEGSEFAVFVTYPVRCVRLMELLSLAALDMADAPGLADDLCSYVVDFVTQQPGSAHPVSDRFAVSLLPIAIVLARSSLVAAAQFLERVAVWTCDRYSSGELGMAGIGASPEEEVQRVLGGRFEHVALRPRRLSYVATVLLDLLVVLELEDLYEDVLNDFLAVRLSPCVIEVGDTPDQYTLSGDGVIVEAGVEYREEWRSLSNGPAAPHHGRGPDSYYLNRINRPWDHLAVSLVLRDRHCLPTLRQLRELNLGTDSTVP